VLAICSDCIAADKKSQAIACGFLDLWALVDEVRTFFRNGVGTEGLSHQEKSSVTFLEQMKRILRDFGVLRQAY